MASWSTALRLPASEFRTIGSLCPSGPHSEQSKPRLKPERRTFYEIQETVCRSSGRFDPEWRGLCRSRVGGLRPFSYFQPTEDLFLEDGTYCKLSLGQAGEG